MKLGAAQGKAPAAWRLVRVELPVQGTAFGFWLNRKKLREARRHEGRYLLRTNLTESDPAKLLPARHPRSSAEESRAGPHHTQRVGEVLCCTNDRRAGADHRRTRALAHALHAVRARTEAPVGATEAPLTAAAATESHRHAGRFRHPAGVPTSGGASLTNQPLSLGLTPESAKTG